MDQGFWKSKEFVIGSVISLVLVSAGVGVMAFETAFFEPDDCRVQPPLGAGVVGAPTDSGARADGATMTRTFAQAYDIADNLTLVLNACAAVGGVQVSQSTGDQLTVKATVRLPGGKTSDVGANLVQIQAGRDGNTLMVSMQHDELPRYQGFFESRSAAVHVVVSVPAQAGTLDLGLKAGTGDVYVSNLAVRDLRIDVGVGDIEVDRVRVSEVLHSETAVGDQTLLFLGLGSQVEIGTSVGNIDMTTQGAKTGRWDLWASVGDVTVRAPRADVGYAIELAADVGEVVADIGETELMDRSSEGPTGHLKARTQGFASAPHRVTMDVQTSVGGIQVTTG